MEYCVDSEGIVKGKAPASLFFFDRNLEPCFFREWWNTVKAVVYSKLPSRIAGISYVHIMEYAACGLKDLKIFAWLYAFLTSYSFGVAHKCNHQADLLFSVLGQEKVEDIWQYCVDNVHNFQRIHQAVFKSYPVRNIPKPFFQQYTMEWRMVATQYYTGLSSKQRYITFRGEKQ